MEFRKFLEGLGDYQLLTEDFAPRDESTMGSRITDQGELQKTHF
jgi:hypothetical protein